MGDGEQVNILELPNWMEPYREVMLKTKSEKNPPSKVGEKARAPSKAHLQRNYTYCQLFYEIGLHCETLLNKAENGTLVLSFDLDWPDAYKSVFKPKQLHICSGDSECAIYKLSELKSPPKALTLLLEHPNVRLVGYDIRNDLIKFGKYFNLKVDDIISKLEEPQKYSGLQLSCSHGWSIECAAEKGLNPSKEHVQIPKTEKLTFKGLINFTNTINDCGVVCERLLRVVSLFPGDQNLVFGFDLEWPFTFKSGSGKVALIQMCADERICFLFHVAPFKSLPKALVLLLKHPHVKLTGLNIANDIRKLGRDFKFEVADILKDRIVELSSLANSKLNTYERWSLDRLVLNQLNLVLPKPKNVRVSDWAKTPLSSEQIKYAAADAYASLAVYNQLMETHSPNLVALLK